MKKILFLCFLMLSVLGFAQSAEQQKILSDSRTIIELYDKKDYNKILEMSHPALLQKFDKETLLSAFKMIFEGNDDFAITIDKVDKNAYQISDIHTEGGTRYAFVDYPMAMTMTFKKQAFDEETKKRMISMMEVQGMKAKFLSDNTLAITKRALTVAVNDKSTNNEWKYVNHDPNSPMYTMIIPTEIIKKANTYYADLLLKDKENGN